MEPETRGVAKTPPLKLWDGIVPWLLAALLLAPAICWVAQDRSVWSWDPSFYAEGTVDLWFKLVHHPTQWPAAMLSALAPKAPGIAWLGQFFVPVGELLGSVEAGLLASVLLAHLATLVLTFHLGRRIAPGSPIPAVVGTLFLAAAPLYGAMSHHFLTEALQAFAITYIYWVASASSSLSPLRGLLHLVLATSIGFLAKVSTPALVVFPFCLAAFNLARGVAGLEWRRAAGKRELFLGIVAVAVAGMGLLWYRHNWKDAWAFARLAVSGEVALDYGTKDTVFNKLIYWLGAMRKSFLAPETLWLLLPGAVVALVLALRRRHQPQVEDARGARGTVVAAALQIAIVLVILSFSINQERRYLLGLAPSLAVVLIWLAAIPRLAPIRAGLLLMLVAQWALVHARFLALIPPSPERTYWEGSPVVRTPLIRELSRLDDDTCNGKTAGRSIMTGVDLDWLNMNTLSFYSAKARLQRGFRCNYVYLGHAAKDPEAAWATLGYWHVAYFISLEESAMQQPPDFLNRVSLAVLKRLEHERQFRKEPFDSESHIAVFRSLEEALGSPKGDTDHPPQ